MTTPGSRLDGSDVHTSIAIFAWNEEESIVPALRSLFAQSFFSDLLRRGLRCEVACVLNGCTDRTAENASRYFFESGEVTAADHVRCRVVELSQRGKLNAWNHFVHQASSPEARYLFMMDADIAIRGADTLLNMVRLLENDSEAHIAVDKPRKHIEFKRPRSLTHRLSLAASHLTQAAPAQLCAQLYCIRADVARNIYMPADLPACEDGFIKALVCSDSLTKENNPARIKMAADAEHTFEAYTNPLALLRNQKRQILGQTVVHLLIDQHLRGLPINDRLSMARTIMSLESSDPAWLRKLVALHLARTKFFWRLCPGYIGVGFERWRRIKGPKKVAAFPAVIARFCLAATASYMAYRSLKQGSIDYWPKAERRQQPNAVSASVQEHTMFSSK